MSAENLMNGVSEHEGQAGAYGFSVQAGVGVKIEALAADGRIRNAQLGVATAGEIRRAGYQVVKTPGAGSHYTVVVPKEFSDDAATGLAKIFRQQLNPWKDRRRA